MTWTALELIKELRALPADCEVFLVTGDTDVQAVTAVRSSWPARARRALRRHIVSVRVIRRDDLTRVAFIQGEKP